jgi:putative nucleotidyltransferase with HDIG domain
MPSNSVFTANTFRFLTIIFFTGLAVFSFIIVYQPVDKSNFYPLMGVAALMISLCTLLSLIILRALNGQEMPVRTIILFLCWIPFFLLAAKILIGFKSELIYCLPVGILLIVIKYFYNENLSFATYLATILCISIAINNTHEWLFLQLFSGLLILFLPFDSNKPLIVTSCIFTVSITSCLALSGLKMLNGSFNESVDLLFFLVCIQPFLLLLAYIIIPVFEKIFSLTSTISLTELSSLDNFLLKELSLKAPGTFQHSIQVSYLAEAAAQKIHVNSLLCRVGGLYHDIGKMMNPTYFNENMQNVNPYENQSLNRSAALIIKHVKDGVALGKKYHLPEIIIDFIRTHHGTTKVEYFYRKFKASPEDCNGKDADFTYPGPKPSTREQSIVMLADTVEAACRSLKNPTEKEMFDLIDRLIENKIRLGQFQESRLSFEELELCKDVFKDYIKTFYHQRISYPEPVHSGQEFL